VRNERPNINSLCRVDLSTRSKLGLGNTCWYYRERGRYKLLWTGGAGKECKKAEFNREKNFEEVGETCFTMTGSSLTPPYGEEWEGFS